MEKNMVVFNEQKIRRVFDEDTETWYFSVVDIIAVLTEQSTARGATLYWSKLKERLRKEGSQLLTNCQQLKLVSQDGKKRLTDVADTEVLLRLVQSVPSPKAEPIKLWLAKVGYERLKEIEDPETGVARAKAIWEKQGRTEDWINQRLLSIRVRNALTGFWDEHGIKAQEFGILTGITHKEWTGLSVREHKNLKGLKSQNLRDHMSDDEIILTMLAELSTRRIAENMDATGLVENAQAAKEGGGIARKAREELELKTGQSVVSKENFLPE